MNSGYRSAHQRGAVLLIALVMLLVLTLLAVTGVREATLESRITANKAHALQLVNSSEAALREAEFRYFNPISLRDKLEPREANCALTNVLKANGANKPCLLPVKKDKDAVKGFVVNPIELDEDNQESFLEAGWDGLLWMPYRGRDHAEETEAQYNAQWNTYLISGGAGDDPPMNVEYGAFGEGKGTYFYLANGQSGDSSGTTRGAQSTFANVYVGLNN
jgi:type IV pilus assembly protein PilX